MFSLRLIVNIKFTIYAILSTFSRLSHLWSQSGVSSRIFRWRLNRIHTFEIGLLSLHRIRARLSRLCRTVTDRTRRPPSSMRQKTTHHPLFLSLSRSHVAFPSYSVSLLSANACMFDDGVKNAKCEFNSFSFLPTRILTHRSMVIILCSQIHFLFSFARQDLIIKHSRRSQEDFVLILKCSLLDDDGRRNGNEKKVIDRGSQHTHTRESESCVRSLTAGVIRSYGRLIELLTRTHMYTVVKR